jgi:S-methylmethionine-dependent homocysteine/selenocysteine methylase
MPQYRQQLPQTQDRIFLTDGGLETTLIFHDGLELPDFAAFHLLRDEAGRAALRNYFRAYMELAKRFSTGFILESPTWRANPDWGTRLGYSAPALTEANREAMRLMEELRAEMDPGAPVVLSGCVGPRGDGYVPLHAMGAEQAAAYHRAQVETFVDTQADMVCAITMNYTAEATGVARAAQRAGMPVAISFTVETDGRLPTGQPLGEAIAEVDGETEGYPSYYMLNCAHPEHVESALAGAWWRSRIQGLRANASRRSHAELNDSADLDIGDPIELGLQYARLRRELLPRMNVVGGCCGTDHRHVEQIAATVTLR